MKYIKKWHEKTLFFLIFRREKERKATFSEFSYLEVVTSYLSPIIAKKARSFGTFRDFVLFYEIRKSAFLALFWH